MSEPKDVREMRQRINQAVRGYGDRVDGKQTGMAGIAPMSSMIRAVLMLAERDGWSGEDTMTALAYHAIVRCESLYDNVIEFHNIMPPSPMILSSQIVAPPPATSPEHLPPPSAPSSGKGQ